VLAHCGFAVYIWLRCVDSLWSFGVDLVEVCWLIVELLYRLVRCVGSLWCYLIVLVEVCWLTVDYGSLPDYGIFGS
jgi:hypothetical protein